MFNARVFTAELIGTFALTFIGAGAGVAGAGLVGVALAHGFVLAVFCYVYGHISGTHVNPAVTFGLALNRTITWTRAMFSYWLPQFAGAIVAAVLLQALFGSVQGGATVGSLTASAPVLAMAVEAILTFFLVNTVLHAAVAGKAGPWAGWAIGTTLAFAILAGGPFTGASLNPARTFGPALLTGDFTKPMTYVIYFLGPLVGSSVAVGVFKFLTVEDTAVPQKKTPAKRR